MTAALPIGDAHPTVSSMLQYMEDVQNGTQPACVYIRQAVSRAWADFDRDWQYEFDADAAERVCRFASRLRHIKGPCAGQTFRIEPWEAFILCQLFGWVVKEGPRKGGRRFRRGYLEVPRGNGKSFLFSAIGLYMLVAAGEQGGEVYSAAPTRDQAKIILETMQNMARKSTGLSRKFRIQVFAHSIFHQPSLSRAESLSSDSKSIDGRNIFLGMLDELHLHSTRSVYDAVETGCGKRPSSMMLMITTAGAQTVGICYEQHTYLAALLSGEYEDPTTFGVIYTVDEGEEEQWGEESIVRKANPNYGVSVEPDYLKSLITKAQVSEAARGNFKRRHLNIWSDEGFSWISREIWMQGAREGLTVDKFLEQHPDALVYIGVDLASRRDFAAMTVICVDERDGHDAIYAVFPSLYIHQEYVQASDIDQLPDWVKAGWVNVNPGNVTDYTRIEDRIVEISRKQYVEEMAYDPYEAVTMAKHLEEVDGIQALVEVPQTVVHLSQPAKEIEPLILEGRLIHDGNPAMAWMVSNAVVQEDRNQNIFLRKRNADDPGCKIDGPASMVTGMVRAIREEDRGPSVYETEDLSIVESVEDDTEKSVSDGHESVQEDDDAWY